MALAIRTEFELDCPKAQAWLFMTDATRAVPCFPGAELGALRNDGFYDGSFGVKLGPMALKFAGKFKVEPVDEMAGLLKVQAIGQDGKGRGSAKSDVRCELTEADGKTRVSVNSNVELTGSIAQFGRAAGMIEVISKQLLSRFSANVKEELNRASVAIPAAVATSPAIADHPTVAPGPVAAEAIAHAQTAASLWQRLRAWFSAR